LKIAEKCLAVLLAASLLLSLSGCFPSRADELYHLPEISDTYRNLQEAVDDVLREGAEYSSPASGSHRQAVQLEDLDGDGIQEAVAFFRMYGGGESMAVCVFQASEETEYTEVARITGEGTGFDKVTYADIDGDGFREILIGWQMSAELKLLKVYSLPAYQPAAVLSANYSDFLVGDFTGDGIDDVGAVRMNPGASGGEAELYTMTEDGEVVSSRAMLSTSAEALTRLRRTELLRGDKGFLTESVYASGGVITDIFAWRNDALVNLSVSEDTGNSDETARNYAVYATDLNSDGIVEVPHPVPMTVQSESTVYYRLDWTAYGVYGQAAQVMTTYHNYTDGWYLELDPSWDEFVTVRRADSVTGERSVIFSVADEKGNVLYDYLVIYTLSGDNREERAALAGRFELHTEGSTVYAAQLLASSPGYGAQLTEQDVQDSFHIIYSDWETGEN